jgi:hypothetical protein
MVIIAKENNMKRYFEITPRQSGEIIVVLAGDPNDKDLEKCMTYLERWVEGGSIVTVEKCNGQLTLLFKRKGSART